jgi:hypothetical protein
VTKFKNSKNNAPQEFFKNNKLDEVNLKTLELTKLVVDNDKVSSGDSAKNIMQDKDFVMHIRGIVQEEIVKWCDKNLAKFIEVSIEKEMKKLKR